MIIVKYIKNFEENDEDIIESKEFPNAKDRWDSEVREYTYRKLLDLDSQYNFTNWENAPSIDEVIYDDKGKILACCSCIELYYSL